MPKDRLDVLFPAYSTLQQMKQALMEQLMARGTMPLGEESTFILNKVAKVVTEVAKRDWLE
jgi:hypothetical protein